MIHVERLRHVATRAVALAVAVGLVVAGVSACGSSSESSGNGGGGGGGDITVGLITKTDTNPFFVKMKAGAQKAATKARVKLMTAAGKYDGDNASQVTAINNMIAAGAKGILLVPSDTKAIVPTVEKARKQGVKVITLDTPLEPQTAADALFATNNFTAGKLIGQYAKAAMKGKKPTIAMMDLNPGITVGDLRHNGFLSGLGIPKNSPDIVCSQYTQGDQAKGQAAMENCLQKDPNINLVYSINEPSGLGAYNALQKAGKANGVLLVSVDGGCTGVKGVKDGKIAATSQQYPLKMASEGVQAIVDSVRNSAKVSGYHDTGVNLITAKPMAGVPSKDVQFGIANCWG
ncbi:sugar ABC transporter substrate-binding protein [Candidatus Solirubrobacter pratensis]|uniref:sugar ABC transporter substrate-binding protein n=1 Tax=Candidatus Solirubrobacter pratensis TaxID=1298857 RepID=UPI00040272E5|nr:sugar ABC transporter substrate-binding protein [Candidatus Solirubrobacter pratensis]